jgi:hypothetical protein
MGYHNKANFLTRSCSMSLRSGGLIMDFIGIKNWLFKILRMLLKDKLTNLGIKCPQITQINADYRR